MGQLSGWLRIVVVAVLVMATLYALPNVLTQEQRAKLPGFLPDTAMNLGLDLQGGAHLVMEVDMNDVMVRANENLEDRVRQFARDSKIGYVNLRMTNAGVELVLRDPNQAEALRTGLAGDGVTVTVGADGETMLAYSETALNDMRKRALGQTLQVLRSRVDQFGVAEPVIQQQGDRRVIVELPGVQDVERAKAAIGKTAQLTFHMVDENADSTSAVVPAGRLRLNETLGQGVNAREVPITMMRRPSLTGEMLTHAAASFDQHGAP
ncbi:MAG: protein translocase subunit SecD, partial [Alphaproteobacteria bacterium]